MKKKFRGTILNKEGKAIFSRSGKFDSKEECLQHLHVRVCVDAPSEFDFIIDYRNHLSGGLGTTLTHKPLKSYYKDISKLKFVVDEL